MLSAQEARNELKKDPIDRVSDKQIEEMKLVTQMFSAELEEKVTSEIKNALLANKVQCSFSYHVHSFTEQPYNWFNNHTIQHSYGLFEEDSILHTSTVLERAFNKMIKEVVGTQADELIELGYCVDTTYSDEHFSDILLKDNKIEISIEWGIEKPVKEQDELSEADNQREVVSVSTAWEPSPSEYAQSQSELKELPKKKKKWWERLI